MSETVTARKAKVLPSTASVTDALALLQSGEWTPEDYAAWDASRKITVVIPADNMTADTFATLTKLDHEGDEDKRELMVEKSKITLKPKRFSTGSVGYNANGKVILTVGGKPAKFQFSGNFILIGSKPVEE